MKMSTFNLPTHPKSAQDWKSVCRSVALQPRHGSIGVALRSPADATEALPQGERCAIDGGLNGDVHGPDFGAFERKAELLPANNKPFSQVIEGKNSLCWEDQQKYTVSAI